MLVDDSISDCAFAKFTVKKHVVNNKKISVVLNVFSLNFFALFLKNKMMKKLVAKTKSSIETLSSGITEECEGVGVGVDVGIGECEGNIQSGLTCQSLAATVKGRKSNIKIVAINNVFFNSLFSINDNCWCRTECYTERV